jgi:hypothetical protein
VETQPFNWDSADLPKPKPNSEPSQNECCQRSKERTADNTPAGLMTSPAIA